MYVSVILSLLLCLSQDGENFGRRICFLYAEKLYISVVRILLLNNVHKTGMLPNIAESVMIMELTQLMELLYHILFHCWGHVSRKPASSIETYEGLEGGNWKGGGWISRKKYSESLSLWFVNYSLHAAQARQLSLLFFLLFSSVGSSKPHFVQQYRT